MRMEKADIPTRLTPQPSNSRSLHQRSGVEPPAAQERNDAFVIFAPDEIFLQIKVHDFGNAEDSVQLESFVAQTVALLPIEEHDDPAQRDSFELHFHGAGSLRQTRRDYIVDKVVFAPVVL